MADSTNGNRIARKHGCVIASIVIALVVALPTVGMRYVQLGVIGSYYEWALAGMIVSYAEEHEGMIPQTWDDLIGYEYHSVHTPSLRTIDEAKQFLTIDFDAIGRLKNGENWKLVPPAIRTRRGYNLHWIDPNFVLQGYFRDGTIPEGTLRRHEADKRRKHFEENDN
jgi:hypothetical protein